jgi:putative spermidine/putrescine transport system ATP-binding protein
VLRRPGLRGLGRSPGGQRGRRRSRHLPVGAAGADLHPDGQGGREGPNRLPASVQNTIYLGDHALAVLQVAGNEEFMVKLQPGAHGGLSHGQSVSITFRPEDCLALDPV